MSGKISYQLGLDAMPLRRGIAGAMDSIRSFSSGLMKLTGIAGGLGALGGALGSGFGAIKSINLAADLEDTAMSFEVMLKSGARAAEMLKDIQKFADPTDFGFAELADAAKNLLSKNAEAGGIMGDLRMLGDIARGSGKDINELAEAYGRVRQSKRLSGEELQLFQGTPLMSELMKQLGVGSAGIRKMAEDGKLDFTNLQKAFQALTGEGGVYNKMVEKMGQTFNAKMNTLGDTFRGLLREFGKPINMALKPLIEKGSGFLASMQEGGRRLGESAASGIRIATELFRSGELGGVLTAGLELGAVKAANLLGQGLAAAFTGLVGLLTDVGTWKGLADVLTSVLSAFGDGLAKTLRNANPFNFVGDAEKPGEYVSKTQQRGLRNAALKPRWDSLGLPTADLEKYLKDAIGRARLNSNPEAIQNAMVPGLGLVRLARQNALAMQEELAYQMNEAGKVAFAAMGDGPGAAGKGGGGRIRAASSLAAVGGWLGGAGSAEGRVLKSQLDTQKAILKVNSEIAKNTAKFKGGIFLR